MNKKQYFGGTGITLEKLKKICPTINVDGTTYKIEEWLKECEVFDTLIVNKSKIWVPYSGAEEYGVLRKITRNIRSFSFFSPKEELKDWWVSEPYLEVELNGLNWYVYEVSIYKKWVKRKSQLKELNRRSLEPKRKFLSYKDINNLKKIEAIENRKLKEERKQIK